MTADWWIETYCEGSGYGIMAVLSLRVSGCAGCSSRKASQYIRVCDRDWKITHTHTHTHRCVSGWARLFGMQAGLCSLYQWSKWKWIATFVTFPTVYRFVCKTERHFEVKNAKTRIMSLAGLLYVLFGSPERWSEVKWSKVKWSEV